MKKTLTILCLAAVAISAVSSDKKHEKMNRFPMAAMIAEKSGADFEAEFLALMIHHHMGGEPMWMLAREKSKNDSILAMEKKITPKEKKEVEQMTGWLKTWHGKTPQDFKEPEDSKKMMETDMAALKAAGEKEFDTLFAEKMAHHHMGAIEMGKLADNKAEHAEVKAFAKSLVEAQTKEREKLLEIAK